MRIGIVLASALLGFTALMVQAQQSGQQPPAAQKHKHPYLHHALHALFHAHHELKESPEEFAGHKAKAEHAIHGAIKNIEAILKHEKDGPYGTSSKGQLTEAHKKYTHHPFLHHALHEVKIAHHQLKESKDDFGGHRAKALKEMDHAIHQIELVLQNAKQTAKTKS